MIQPEAPYGQAKFAGEGYLGLWKRMHDLSTVSLRFGNVYGPRQDPLGEAGVIAIFCGKLETGGQPTVFGDGRQTRDYIYVEDVVRACLLAAGSDVNGSFNVGRGEEVSVLELVDALRELGGELGMLERRPHVRAPVRAGADGRGPALRARPDALTRRARLQRRGRAERRPAPHAPVRRARAGRGVVSAPSRERGSLRAVVALARERVERLDLPRLVRARRRLQPAARVALPHADQLLDELRSKKR